MTKCSKMKSLWEGWVGSISATLLSPVIVSSWEEYRDIPDGGGGGGGGGQYSKSFYMGRFHPEV